MFQIVKYKEGWILLEKMTSVPPDADYYCYDTYSNKIVTPEENSKAGINEADYFEKIVAATKNLNLPIEDLTFISYSKEEFHNKQFKEITGFDTVEEWNAYELGQIRQENSMMTFIEKWNGKTNSMLGSVLAGKFKELYDKRTNS